VARWQPFLAGAVVGAAVTLGLGYLYTKELRTFMAHAPYVRAASEAKLDTAVLRKLNAGEFSAALELTDARLKIHEATLNEYQQHFPLEAQDAAVLAGAAEVAQYRSEWPR
jgi:hypothetical protein